MHAGGMFRLAVGHREDDNHDDEVGDNLRNKLQASG